MIKIFRRIRQNLLSENKFSKYLIYALGEIILVVIGILIALQINNSNNTNKLRTAEQTYLHALQAEFNTNLERIDMCLLENKERLNVVEDMLTLFDHNVRDTMGNEVMSDIFHTVYAGEATYVPSKGVLTDIISSGNLNLIKNKKLRQNLASFESNLDFMKLHQNSIYSKKIELENHLYTNGSVRRILLDKGRNFKHQSISDSVNNKQLFDFVEFENTLLDYYLTINASNGPRFFGGIKDHISIILAEIDSEIKH